MLQLSAACITYGKPMFVSEISTDDRALGYVDYGPDPVNGVGTTQSLILKSAVSTLLCSALSNSYSTPNTIERTHASVVHLTLMPVLLH
jgi:hypothetical protein